MTEEYFDDNNPLKGWINENLVFTDLEKDKISVKEILEAYNDSDYDSKYNKKNIMDAIRFNNLPTKSINNKFYVLKYSMKSA